MTRKFIVREYNPKIKTATWFATAKDFKEMEFKTRKQAIKYLEKARKEPGQKEYYEVVSCNLKDTCF